MGPPRTSGAARPEFFSDDSIDVVARHDRSGWLSLDGRVPDGDDLLIVFRGVHPDEIEQVGALHSYYPMARFVLLDTSFELETVIVAIRNGFDGCILENEPPDIVIASLQLASMGQKVIPPAIAELLFDRHGERQEEDHLRVEDAHLSEREREIVGYLVRGATNKVISRSLNIAEATVKVHVKAVLRKLHLHNRTQAAIWGIASGIRRPDDPPAITCENQTPRHLRQ